MSSAHLLVRLGPDRFEPVSLGTGPLTIGRHPDSGLHLEDRAVSRRHAVVEWDGDHVILHDRGSRGGTWVNGGRVRGATELEDGDWIRVGRTLAVLRTGDPTDGDRDDLERLAVQTGLLPEHALESRGTKLDPARVVLSLPALTEVEDETISSAQMSLLADVGRSLQSVHELDEVLSVLLGYVFDVFGPDRGAVLVIDSETGDLVPAMTHPETDIDFVSRTVLDHAIHTRTTVAVMDLGHEDSALASESIALQSIRAAVCCPMIQRGELVGALYLDTRSEGLQARREEIGLLNLIACYAATSIENARLLADRDRARHLEDLDREPLVAESPRMRALLDGIEEIPRSNRVLRIEGEPGTGKLLVARHLHVRALGADAPFQDLDAARIPGPELRSALFGREVDEGAWSRARGGSLVVVHAEAMDRSTQDALAARLDSERELAPAMRPRLVVTLGETLEEAVQRHVISPALASALGDVVIEVPRLKDRREDIPALAQHFLHRVLAREDRSRRRLSEAALGVLERAKFRQANARELRQSVELASILADGETIEPEHVFTGPPVRNHRFEVDVAGNPWVEFLLRARVQSTLQGLFAVSFVGLILVCLIADQSPAGRIANGLVWGLWWPSLLLLFLFVGRAWCTWCPLSRLARWGQRLGSLGRRPPQWVKDHAGWTMTALFGLILWSEQVFGMTHRPTATAIFLLSLASVATVVAMTTRREVWCRYACPLGNLGAGFSVPAAVHVHANPAICTSRCRTHECYKGNESEPGCPMFLHPLYVKDTHFCKLCLSCVRSCPNGSARIWWRPPLQDLWTLTELNPSLVPLAWTVFFLTPLVLAASQGRMGFDDPRVFTGALLASACAALFAERSARRGFDQQEDAQTSRRIAFTMLLLAWGPFMAFHLEHVPGLDRVWIREDLAGQTQASPLGFGVPLLESMQLLAILGATLAAGLSLWQIRRQHRASSASDHPGAWWSLAALAVAYVGLALTLVS